MALANDSAKDVNLTQQGHSTACGRFVCPLLLPAPPPLAVVVVVGRQSFCCFASSLVSMVMVDDVRWMDFCREKNFKFLTLMWEKKQKMSSKRAFVESRATALARASSDPICSWMLHLFARFLLSYNE
jgi:hypothetical protein